MDNNTLERLGRQLFIVGIVIIVAYTGVTWAITPPLHQDDPEYTPNETTLLGAGNAYHEGGVYEIAPNGSVVWERHNANYYNDVSRLPDGRIRATYTITTTECGPYTSPCGRTGIRIIDPETGDIDWEYSYLTRTRIYSEVHDAEILEDRNEMLVVGMDRERVFTVDMDTKEITWQWNASERYDPPPDPTKSDWLHMNDVDRIAPGEYMVSVRNANEVVIVNRSCTCITEIINEGGDPNVLNHQHNPQWLDDGVVLVADSENDRIVELHNSSEGWRIAWAIYGANGVRFDWPRDADRLDNGHTLITDTRNNRLVEVTRGGEVKWSVSIPEQGYDADRGDTEYPAGPVYSPTPHEQPMEQPFVIFDILYGGVRHHVPLPHWVTAWHILMFVIGANGICVGLLLAEIGRRRDQEPDDPGRLDEPEVVGE